MYLFASCEPLIGDLVWNYRFVSNDKNKRIGLLDHFSKNSSVKVVFWSRLVIFVDDVVVVRNHGNNFNFSFQLLFICDLILRPRYLQLNPDMTEGRSVESIGLRIIVGRGHKFVKLVLVKKMLIKFAILICNLICNLTNIIWRMPK